MYGFILINYDLGIGITLHRLTSICLQKRLEKRLCLVTIPRVPELGLQCTFQSSTKALKARSS